MPFDVSQIRRLDLFVRADLLRRSTAQHAALVENHDGIALTHDEVHVVLDEDHRTLVLAQEGPHALGQTVDLNLFEPGGRLVEQQQPGCLDDGSGELDHAGLADGE